jgi:hypothetical protein
LSTSRYQTLAIRSGDTKSLLFIFGHQRSGTTLMTQLFDRDPSVKVYGEYSPLSVPENGKPGLRLRPLPEIATHIGRGGARIVILKPLVESQNARRILSYFSGSKALWMYRGYDDVVASKIKKSGNKRGSRPRVGY